MEVQEEVELKSGGLSSPSSCTSIPSALAALCATALKSSVPSNVSMSAGAPLTSQVGEGGFSASWSFLMYCRGVGAAACTEGGGGGGGGGGGELGGACGGRRTADSA